MSIDYRLINQNNHMHLVKDFIDYLAPECIKCGDLVIWSYGFYYDNEWHCGQCVKEAYNYGTKEKDIIGIYS